MTVRATPEADRQAGDPLAAGAHADILLVFDGRLEFDGRSGLVISEGDTEFVLVEREDAQQLPDIVGERRDLTPKVSQSGS